MEAVLRHSSDSKSCRNGILINVLFSYFGFVVYDKKNTLSRLATSLIHSQENSIIKTSFILNLKSKTGMYLAGRRKTINKQHLRSQKTIQKDYIPRKIPFQMRLK